MGHRRLRRAGISGESPQRVVKALLDTNILIDYLRGLPEARVEIGLYDDPAISIVSWMEVMVGAPPALEAGTRAFLDRFVVVGLDQAVAERAVAVRQGNRLKLPDAIVWASALVGGRLLVTRNARVFPAGDPGVRVPYRV
jgi:predicted nucleic acid-binding protein